MEMKNLEYITPTRAWRKIKASVNLCQPLYIYGISTIGKTELVRQFFSKKRYLYYSIANGEFPTDIPEADEETPTIVILDDLSLLFDHERRQEVIKLILRRDIQLIMLSRCHVPEWLFSIYIKSGFTIIEESDLCLDRNIIMDYFSRNGVTVSEHDVDYIISQTRGNAFAVCYLMRRLKEGMTFDETLFREIRERFISYIEKNIVSQWDSELSDFLTQISVVDEFDEGLAEYITGNKHVGVLLKKVQEIGNFLTKIDNTYTIMPIVLTTLRARAEKNFGKKRINEYMYNAGLYYETHDELLKALALYEKSGSNDRIRELLICNARQNPGVGHYYELKDYYLKLKDEDIEGTPVLMSGVSMIYSMMLQKEKSEYWYNKLKEFVNTSKGGEYREAVSRLAFLDISLAHRGSKNITDILMNACEIFDKLTSIPEFSVTSNLPSVINGGKDFCALTVRDREFISKYGVKIEKLLGRYGKGLMDTALAESLYEKGGDAYEILSLISRARLQIEAGGTWEIALICICLQVRLNLFHGNESAASELLLGFQKCMEEQKFTQLLPNIHAMSCRIALHKGDFGVINKWMEEAPDDENEFYVMNRYIYLTKVRCYIATGDYLRAFALLEKLRYYAELCDRRYIRMEVDLFSAVVKYRMADKGWKKHIIDCLSAANELAFYRVISEKGNAVLPLLEQVRKDATVKTKFNKTWFDTLLEETKKTAQKYPMYLKGNVADIPDFSENGLEVLRLQAQGYSISRIAESLSINVDTVKYHCKQNYRKLGVSGKTEAVLAARNLGIL